MSGLEQQPETDRFGSQVEELPMARVLRHPNMNTAYEEKLTSYGATYTYRPNIPLVSIQRYADAQARMRLSGSDVVNQYAEMMKHGQQFPPLVVAQDGVDGTFMLLDGNTRKAAYEKRGIQEADAYIITGVHDLNDLVYLSSLFNGLNGVQLTKEEKYRAIRAAKNSPMPMTDSRISRDLGIPASMVNRLVRQDRAVERLGVLRLPVDFSADTLVAVGDVGDDSVLGEVVRLVKDANLRGADVKDLVRTLSGKTSEAERLQVVADERTALAPVIAGVATGRSTSTPPAKDSLMAFGRLSNLLARHPDPEEWVPVRQETRDEWLPKIREFVPFFTSLVDAYEAAGITASSA
jgi:hypothetical protein